MLVDAHAHLDRYGDQVSEAVAQINDRQIVTVAVAMDIESYLKTKVLAEQSVYIKPAFGVHPWEAPRYCSDLKVLDGYLEETWMIGEAGLDFYFVKDASLQNYQRQIFGYQCDWAARLGKPMNLHTKGAEHEVLEALTSHDLRGCIVHWYSGPVDLIDDYLALGCYFTVGVEVLHSKAIEEIAKAIPIERLLLETDNPGGHKWLAGSPGMPILLLDVLAKVAELIGTVPVELESRLGENWDTFRRGSARGSNDSEWARAGK
jgi:TatD DNase family protein